MGTFFKSCTVSKDTAGVPKNILLIYKMFRKDLLLQHGASYYVTLFWLSVVRPKETVSETFSRLG